MKILHNTLLATLVAAMMTTTSCSESGDDAYPGLPDGTASLSGTKWSTQSFDYLIGDDWIIFDNEIITYVFYSDTEGVARYFRKSTTESGTSYTRHASFFKYTVNGNQIDLDFIAYYDEGFYDWTLYLKGDGVHDKNTRLYRSGLTTSDYTHYNSSQGKTGGVHWYYNDYNSIILVPDGNGVMDNYTSYDRTPWSDKTFSRISIHEGVKSIGDYAFATLSLGHIDYEGTLRQFPETVNNIGRYAFAGSGIDEVFFRGGEGGQIQEGAFKGCRYLEDIYLGDIENVGTCAFEGCSKGSISGGEKLVSAGDFAFDGPEVSSYSFSWWQALEYIGHGAFYPVKGKNLTLPQSLKYIGALAISGSDINNITIGNNSLTITENAFVTAKYGTLTINCTTPPALSGDIICEYQSNWTLKVPSQAVARYKSAPYWSNFNTITGI